MHNHSLDQSPRFYKNPGIATVLSFFFMGLGQLYNEQIVKGIIFIFIYLICFIYTFITMWAFFVLPILWVWGMVDAYKSAKKINYQTATGITEEKTKAEKLVLKAKRQTNEGTIFLLVFLFPVGLFWMWYKQKWTLKTRWIITTIILIILISYHLKLLNH